MAQQRDQSGNMGGNQTAPNRATAKRVLASALANQKVANSLVSALGAMQIAAAIVADSTSTTTDFAALAIGDLLIHIPATAGNASFAVVTAAGTAPAAAVVGDLYVALRAQNLDANNPTVPAAAGNNNGRTTDGF